MAYQNTTHTYLSSQDNFEIFWQKWIPSEPIQRVLIFQHGIGEHSSRYQHLMDAFIGTGTAFYAPELRGHGRTKGIRGHVDHFSTYADDLGDLIRIARDEQEQQKVFLLGHSMGGAIALQFALQPGNQDHLRGLILSSPAIEMPLNFAGAIKKQLATFLSRLIPSVTMDTNINTRFLSHDPQVGQDFQADPLTHEKISIGMGYALFQLHHTFYAKASILTVPTYIFHGTGDQITSPEGSKKFYHLLRQPDKTLRLYDDLYHETMNEREPDRSQVLQDLKNWVLTH